MLDKIRKTPESRQENPGVAQGTGEKLPLIFKIIYILTGVCALLYVIERLSVGFADFMNSTVGAVLRVFFAWLTAWLPFSTAECLLILLIPILTIIGVYGLKYKCGSWRSLWVFVGKILGIACVILCLFVLTFSAGYNSVTVDKKLGLDRQNVTAEELYDTADAILDQLNAEIQNVTYYYDDFSVMPYSLNEMNGKLIDAYDKFCADRDWIFNYYSKVKPVMLSEAMSYTHITGVYSFFTGEANINIAFPDYTIPYTAAHELAHQRGIAREDEANFVAYLVCIGSDDPYIRYSGYMNMFEYISNALYGADKTLYSKIMQKADSAVRGEMIAYNGFYQKYENSTASKVAGTVNNTFLVSQGTPGSKSYGMVVDLAVAYHKSAADTAG